MARIRTIKPEFFTSDDICALSPLARLLYIGLWCEADREGRLAWTPRVFKRRYLPDDDCDIDELCRQLLARDLVRIFGSDDEYAYIPTFREHQHVNPRESRSVIPAPDDEAEANPKNIAWDIRSEVYDRDDNRCVRCGAEEDLTLDHILPRSCGGPHIAENLRVLCRKCNAARPVAGKGLEADLSRDGFTLAGLRVKFGIDASMQDHHAQGGREGRKGKEGNGNDASTTRPPRSTLLPSDWQPSDEDRSWVAKARPDLTPALLDAETERFRNHAMANHRTAFHWGPNWRNWVSKAHPADPSKPPPGKPAPWNG